MIPLIGKLCLWVALVLAFLQASRCAASHRRLVAWGLFSSLLLAGCTLLYAHIISDFSLVNVFENSHTAKPLLYKITGTWGNHEGSMLLLVLFLAGYHAMYSGTSAHYPMAVQLHALVILGFLGFILMVSDPFLTMDTMPAEGMDLNPLLQDIGLAIHPPLLYLGYTGLSLVFVLTITHLVQGTMITEWAASTKSWLIMSWAFLTLGIAAGSWWAYRELGWGGFWFWDPVENTSLMPWLAATALFHSALVLEKRRLFPNWVALLSLLAFILAMVGIFLVRSGLLTSVHSFAQDPGRGLYILGFIGLISLGSSLVYIKYRVISPLSSSYRFFSKENCLLLHTIFTTVFCFTILWGTLYPLFIPYITHQWVSVSAPYFNSWLRWVGAPLLLLAILAPSIAWQQDSPYRLIRRYSLSLILALVGAVITKAGYVFPFLGWWLIIASLQFLLTRPRHSLRVWGVALAHTGLGCLVISLSIVTTGSHEKQALLKLDDHIELGKYTLTLKEMFLFAQDNYLLRQGGVEIREGNVVLTTLHPEIRYYPARGQNTTESAIYRHGLSDIYMVLGDTNGKDAFTVRAYERPFVNGIWLSSLLMAFGILLSIRTAQHKTHS